MNQHRWTCLATVVLSTVILPIANVQANTRSIPVVGSANNYVPVSPQSLPIITPLVVTEIETAAVIPATIKPVPLVSRLPMVKPLDRIKVRARSKQRQPVSTQTAKLPAVTPVFNSNVRATESMISIVNPVAPLPTKVLAKAALPQLSTNLTPKVATISSQIDRLQINPVPQVSSIVSFPKDRADSPTFESGAPVFSINNDRTQQIVNTVIAQVGDTIVAPEPSIAIPVETPKTVNPTKLPVSIPPSAQPQATGTVKVEPTIKPATETVKIQEPATTTKPATEIGKIQEPATTTKPALDKIVATQSGQASWYGIEGGPRTANGERYIPSGLTAAHRTLPFGTKVRVTSLKTGKTVTVRINDRGPFHSRRIIDVSAGAAEVIGIKKDGIGNIKMEILAKEQ